MWGLIFKALGGALVRALVARFNDWLQSRADERRGAELEVAKSNVRDLEATVRIAEGQASIPSDSDQLLDELRDGKRPL